MKRLATLVLFLFAANFVFAAMGTHCANGLFGAPAQAASVAEIGEHDHAENSNHHPAPQQDQGEICSSMQLTAVLSSVSMPNLTQVETNVIWAVASIFAVAVDYFHAERKAAGPPPPLLASDFHSIHARTGRLLI